MSDDERICTSCEGRPASGWCSGCIVEDYEAANGITSDVMAELTALRAVAEAARVVVATVPPPVEGHARATRTTLVVDNLRAALDAWARGRGA